MKKMTPEFRKIAAEAMAVEKRTKKEDYQICIHEAAHTVAGLRLPLANTPHYVTVNPCPDRMIQGWMNDMSITPTRELVKASLKIRTPKANLKIMKARGITPPTLKERIAFGRKMIEESAVVTIAGPAADMRMECDFMDGEGGENYLELTLLYRSRGKNDDPDELFGWRDQLRTILGYDGGEGDWGHAMRKLSAYEDDDLLREEWLLRVWLRSIKFVDKHWEEIERLAKVLKKKRTLDREGMYKALEGRSR